MFDETELIEAFQDTRQQVQGNPELAEKTRRMQEWTRLYKEGFVSAHSRQKSGEPKITVRADTTFHCAQTLWTTGKRTAVLNFANAYSPGGGVLKGAMAQEECLCRSSNLYEALIQPHILGDYYEWNEKNTGDLGTDRIIYSPGVTVFKSDHGCPENLEEWFSVDVITCAAPYYNKYQKKPVSKETLAAVFHSRIRNILETAIDNDVDNLVLGAFGCGAFNNPPQLVAEAFRRLLVDEEYAVRFENVAFAIKTTGVSRKNLDAFRACFQTGARL